MIFARSNVESFGFVCLILFSISLCSGNDALTSLVDNGGAEPLEGARSALPYSYGNYINSLKRAAGFVGMRGKKAYNNNYINDLEASEEGQEDYPGPYYYNPRPSRAGFVGMRGKKEDENTYDKRAGFVGMRGKKADYFPFWFLPQQQSHLVAEALEPSKSRRANSGFVGMRGR